MGALQRFEQRLEHAVTGVFARAFRSAVQPMEIAAALQREVDNSAQVLSRDRRIAPNDFTIELSDTDFDRLSQYGETLVNELAALLHEHGEQQHYRFAGPITMHFTSVPDLTTGRFRVCSVATAHVTPASGQPVSATAIRRASAWLDIAGTPTPLQPPGLSIGRGSQTDIRIDDPGISRRHVEFRLAAGSGRPMVSIVDLGSTNGTTVNGQRVQHSQLTHGDVVQLGGTRIVVHVEQTQAGPPGQPYPAVAGGQPSSAGVEPPPYRPSTSPQQPSYRMPDATEGSHPPHHWSG